MSIKEGNKRIMVTISPEDEQLLKVIMFDLHTRQFSKVFHELIQTYIYLNDKTGK